jgi:hypothetical protein
MADASEASGALRLTRLPEPASAKEAFSAEAHPLFSAAILQLSCTRSSAGQTAEVTDGAGLPLAGADGAGTITDRSGKPLLHAPIAFEGRGERGTDARLEVSDGAGERLGEVRVVKFFYGPRSSRTTLAVTVADGQEVATFEPRDRKGEQVEITVGDVPGGTLEQISRKRGILRSTTTYPATSRCWAWRAAR